MWFKSACRYAIGSIAVVCTVSGPARGSGFAIDQQDPASMATMLAGRAALGNDLNTVFYNPAGMTQISGHAISPSFTGILTSGRFHNGGSTLGGAPLSGGNGGDLGQAAGVPAFHAVASVGDRLLAGTGLSCRPASAFEFDVADAHSFSRDVPIDISDPVTSGNLKGNVDLSADLLSLRALLRF